MAGPARFASPPHLRELHSVPDHVIAMYGNLVLMFSLTEPDSAFIKKGTELIVAFGANRPDGLGLVVFIEESAPPPSEATRIAIRHAYDDLKTYVRGGVHVVQGTGFRAAAKRGALTLLNMAARNPFPMRVVGTPEEAHAALEKLLGPKILSGITPGGLDEASQQLQRDTFVKRLHAAR